jgi:hypothetical protein
MAKAFNIVAAGAIVALSFPATVYVLDLLYPEPIANQKRAGDVKMLRDAIDSYYKDHGSYPVLPGKPVDDLANDLVPRYLKEIPSDPLRAAHIFQYQYASDGHTMYAIWAHQAAHDTFVRSRPEGHCVVSVRGKGGWKDWGPLPECWF